MGKHAKKATQVATQVGSRVSTRSRTEGQETSSSIDKGTQKVQNSEGLGTLQATDIRAPSGNRATRRRRRWKQALVDGKVASDVLKEQGQ